MVPPLLINSHFWEDDSNWNAGEAPSVSGLNGHVFFRTSGTTGAARWIALSKHALRLSAAAVNRHLMVTPESTWGLALPLHHVGGFGVVARAFEAGCKLEILLSKWEPLAFCDWLRKTGVTHTSLVPTQVHDLIASGSMAPSTLVAVVAGGGRLGEEAGRAARALGWPVLASYGMTEACSQIATQPLIALNGIYRSDPLEILPIWRTRLAGDGRLEIAGPALFSGTITAAGGYQPRLEEWYRTSDRVRMDSPHAISPLGRADFMVKVLGELVNPDEICRALSTLSRGVLHSENFSVVAVPDARAQHRLIPVIEMADSSDEIDAFIADYNGQAPGFQRLQKPVFMREFPRTELGKIRRGELTTRVTEEFQD